MEAGSRQLIGDGFLGHYLVYLRLLALIIGFDAWLPDTGIVSSFHKGECEVTVAIFSIALAFLFAIAEFDTGHAASIGRIVTHLFESIDRACFQ